MRNSSTTAITTASDAGLAAGFVSEIVEPANLDARVAELSTRLAQHAPITMRVSKEVRAWTTYKRGGEDDPEIEEELKIALDELAVAHSAATFEFCSGPLKW